MKEKYKKAYGPPTLTVMLAMDWPRSIENRRIVAVRGTEDFEELEHLRRYYKSGVPTSRGIVGPYANCVSSTIKRLVTWERA